MHTLEKDPRDEYLFEQPHYHQVQIWEAIGNSFRVKQLLSGKLKRECTDIREARPQQNSGKTPIAILYTISHDSLASPGQWP